MKAAAKTKGFERLWRRLGGWILGIAIFLLAVRLALPYAVESYVNHVLNKSPNYGGHIGTVNMRLWRGGYRIHPIKIVQKNGSEISPLFSADSVDFSIQWHELFHGSLVAKVEARRPRINFIAGPTPAQDQTGKDQSWDKTLESLFPFQLNRFDIYDGEIHYQDPFSKPPVDIYISKISATATNLSNARDLKQALPAGACASATTLGGGQLDLDLHMNPVKATPTYEITCSLTNVNVTALNDFLRAYGNFDVNRGNFALYTSVAADQGSYQGYFKLFFDDLKVFNWDKEKKKNILEVFWQAIVGTTATIFKNHLKDQLAAKVPVSGTYTNSSVGIWTAISTLLQNAFIHALVPKLDTKVTIDQVNQTQQSDTNRIIVRPRSK